MPRQCKRQAIDQGTHKPNPRAHSTGPQKPREQDQPDSLDPKRQTGRPLQDKRPEFKIHRGLPAPARQKHRLQGHQPPRQGEGERRQPSHLSTHD